MTIRFQNLSELQVKQLKSAVNNILDECATHPFQHTLPNQLITQAQSILHRELTNRNIILEGLASMTIAILDEVSRKINENDQLQCELQNFLAKSKEACLKVLTLKQENQQLQKINNQLYFSLEAVQKQKYVAIFKLQQLTQIYEQNKKKYEIEIKQLQYHLVEVKKENEQYRQRNKIQNNIIEEISQLKINNKSLKEHLVSTKIELNKVHQELRYSKQFVSTEALHMLSILSRKQISLEHQSKEDIQINEQIGSSLKMDLQAEATRSHPILLPNLVEEIQQVEISQYSIHQQPIIQIQKIEIHANEKQLHQKQIIQHNNADQNNKVNQFQTQNKQKVEEAILNLKLNLELNSQIQGNNSQGQQLNKQKSLQSTKKVSRINHLMNVIGQKQTNQTTNRHKQKFKHLNKLKQNQSTKVTFPAFCKNTQSSIKKLTTCESTFSFHRKDTFSTVFQIHS